MEIRNKLLAWFDTHHRRLPWRDAATPYHVWVSEVMLQQTQVKTVIPYYERFLNRFPTLDALAQSDEQDVLKLWEGLGYYARIRNFHKASRIIMVSCQGEIPSDWESFRKLPGVGDYIASAVLSIAFDKGYAVVDGNVKRVLARLFQSDVSVNDSAAYKHYAKFSDTLLDRTSPGRFNQAMMEVGALICTPKHPRCESCPIESFCLCRQNGTVADYPKRLKKARTPEYHVAAGVVYHNDNVLITRRKPDGLLGGLWEFPGGKVQDGESAQEACLREIREETGLEIRIESYLTRVKHAYTHFKIVMDVFRCGYVSGKITLNAATDYRWIRIEEIENYPFPKANHKFMGLL